MKDTRSSLVGIGSLLRPLSLSLSPRLSTTSNGGDMMQPIPLDCRCEVNLSFITPVYIVRRIKSGFCVETLLKTSVTTTE